MIVSSLGQIAPETAHDHEIASRGSSPGGGRDGECPSSRAGAAQRRRRPRSRIGDHPGRQAEPERDDAPDRVGVVAALVTPLLVSGMRRGPVEFRAHPVLLVEVVEVPVAGALPDPDLPSGGRQPVRAFHPMHVAVLQQRTGRPPRRRRAPSGARGASASSCGRPWPGVSGRRSCAGGRRPGRSIRTRRRRSARPGSGRAPCPRPGYRAGAWPGAWSAGSRPIGG